MDLQRAEQVPIRLPNQNPPISREKNGQGADLGQSGVEASQSACDGLNGLARQMCYATEYGVMI